MTHLIAPRVHTVTDFGILRQAPQALFDDVEAQVFPLFADGAQLQLFLNEYYNKTIPREIAELRALAPLVFLTVLYYPRIHGRYREEASALRQHEYYFLVPVGRFETTCRGERLTHTGVVTPYIYVDDPVSATLGREIYGWQKRLFRISAVKPTGANLKEAKPYMKIERPMPGRKGNSLEYRPQMKVYCAGQNEPYDPLRNLGHAAARAGRTFDVLMRATGGDRLEGEHRLSKRRRMAMLAEVGRQLIKPDGTLDVMLMAQFPHCSRVLDTPDRRHFVASYTAFTHATIGLRWLRHFAQLGQTPPWDPDTSRGFCIHFSGQGIENIPSRLGLAVDTHTEDEHGQPVQIVRPFLPFVSGFDMSIESLETVARRSTHTDWLDENDEVLVRRPPRAAALYNTYLGASSAQGFKSYGKDPQTLRFKGLGLRADLETLRVAVRDLAPTPASMRIEPLEIDGTGAVVVLIDNVRRDPSDRNDLVWFSGTYLCFAILCKVTYRGRTRVAFVEAVGFTDNPHAMLVGRELLAADRLLATFNGSPCPWFPPQPTAHPDARPQPDPEEEARAFRRHVMRMDTHVLTSIDAGDRIKVKPLIDIFECTPHSDVCHDHGEIAAFEHLGMQLSQEGALVPLLRVAAIPTTHANRLATAMVRVHCEQITLGAQTEGPDIGSWPLAPHQLRIFRHQSHAIVRRLGISSTYDQERDADLCSTVLAMGGRFDGVRREVDTLFEWSSQTGWIEEHGLEVLFGAEAEKPE